MYYTNFIAWEFTVAQVTGVQVCDATKAATCTAAGNTNISHEFGTGKVSNSKRLQFWLLTEH
ncbi:MAG: hypothetical protein U0U33_23410 [Chitinophagaceae bacterium]